MQYIADIFTFFPYAAFCVKSSEYENV